MDEFAVSPAAAKTLQLARELLDAEARERAAALRRPIAPRRYRTPRWALIAALLIETGVEVTE